MKRGDKHGHQSAHYELNDFRALTLGRLPQAPNINAPVSICLSLRPEIGALSFDQPMNGLDL